MHPPSDAGHHSSASTGLSAFDKLVILRNPASTNDGRSRRLINKLEVIFKDIEQHKQETQKAGPTGTASPLAGLESWLGPRTLLAIAGGDGTVNAVVRALLATPKLSAAARRTPLLPLWGGNANDLAHMLNGSADRVDIASIMRRGRVVKILPIRVHFVLPDTKLEQAHFAVNYVSFGASAAAARAINHKKHRHSRLHRLPGGRMLRELMTIGTAMVKAPRFNVHETETGRRHRIYERVIINGSRFAKVDRVALNLTEPHFSVATVQRKRASALIYNVLRLVGRRYIDEVAQTHLQFTLEDPVNAQIDGENIALPGGTEVSISLSDKAFYALSSRLGD